MSYKLANVVISIIRGLLGIHPSLNILHVIAKSKGDNNGKFTTRSIQVPKY